MSMWKDTSNLGIQVVMVFIEVKVYITNHLLDGMDILKMVKPSERQRVRRKKFVMPKELAIMLMTKVIKGRAW